MQKLWFSVGDELWFSVVGTDFFCWSDGKGENLLAVMFLSDVCFPPKLCGASYHLGSVGDVELLHDASAVKLDGVGADAELRCHVGGREALCREVYDLLLAFRQAAGL